MSTISYDELKNNLIDESLLKENTNVIIAIDGEEIQAEDTISFNEVKNYEIKVKLKYIYSYKEKEKIKKEEVISEKIANINVVDTTFPVINGVKDKTITVGDKLDILNGITATDEKEGNITVQYEGEVNTNKAGNYKITIYAIDQNGNKTEETMNISVKAKSTSKPNTNSSSGSSSSNSSGTTSCPSSNATLKKRGYYVSKDPNACQKDKESSAIAKQIADSILAKGYGTDLEKVEEAASIVSSYYYKGIHIEEGLDYRTPYGVFVKGEASCAGCTRALILVLEYMGFKNITHANENGYTHQWVILDMDGQKGFADGQVAMVGYGCHPVDENCVE